MSEFVFPSEAQDGDEPGGRTLIPRVGDPDKVPVELRYADLKLALRVGGVPVDLKLVRRVVIDIAADSLIAHLRLELVATAVLIEADSVAVGVVRVPLRSAAEVTFGGVRVPGAGPGPEALPDDDVLDVSGTPDPDALQAAYDCLGAPFAPAADEETPLDGPDDREAASEPIEPIDVPIGPDTRGG